MGPLRLASESKHLLLTVLLGLLPPVEGMRRHQKPEKERPSGFYVSVRFSVAQQSCFSFADRRFGGRKVDRVAPARTGEAEERNGAIEGTA